MAKKITCLLLAVFLISFLARLAPIYKGYNAPFGNVDTSSHIASALDLSEGNLKSLMHPWWHAKNHYLVNGYDVVDRNYSSFFYPPFINTALAFSFLFAHPGIASAVTISFLYSLSVFAIFLLCKSFKIKDMPSLVSAVLVAVSSPLAASQNYGFWTFAIASNFIILSYSFLRLRARKFTWLSIIFYFFALTTHWAFFGVALLAGLVELAIGKNKEAKFYLLAAAAITLPFYLLIIYTANPPAYITTHFNGLALPNPLLILLAASGLALAFRKHMEMAVFAILALMLSFAYYALNIKFAFGDMVQFAYPFLAAFYAGSLLHYSGKKAFKLVVALTAAAIVLEFVSVAWILGSAEASISKNDFDGLLKLRKELSPDSKSIIAIERGLFPWWITIASKDSKILYPDTYEAEDISQYRQNYIVKETNGTGYVFYKIAKRNNSLIIEKNAALPDSYRFGK
ncbi:hypothetical protein HYT53_00945 [Candidatus Woesearchaeota archaeon]|nr:hypothetical protein [Candidatus Woesearchaeota archaeon]